MIAILRKNLVCSIFRQNSFFFWKSHVSLSVSLHFFSTLRERQLVPCPRFVDVLVNAHHFSPEFASRVASDVTRFRSPEKADSMLSFLEENSFSSTQLEKIVKYDPQILWGNVEGIKFKIKILQELGLSSEDIAKIISSNQVILQLSSKNKIIPSLSLLKVLLGSNYDVAGLLRRSAWCLYRDLEKTLVPNVEFLKNCGIPMERILFFFYRYPRLLLMKPDIIKESVDKAKEMGCSQSSKLFLHAVRIIASTGKGKWEVKLQAFRDLGFSDSDILAMFRKAPAMFGGSMKKIEKITELLYATGKFNISSIVSNPASLGCSFEKRLEPRLRILGILESRNLIEKWPGLSTIYLLSNDKFFERFIRPYSDEVGKVYIAKSYVKGEER